MTFAVDSRGVAVDSRRLGRRIDPAKRIEYRCESCGAAFWRLRTYVAMRGDGRFCSRPCAAKGQTKRGTVTCRWCGKTTDGIGRPGDLRRGKFCDRSCYTAWNRTQRTVEFDCDHCGQHFTRSVSFQAKAKGWFHFCSRECSAAHQVGAAHHAHRGDLRPQRGARWNAKADTIRERDGNLCVRCGQPEVGRKLSVDHIIPARWFGADGDAASVDVNLASLCNRCHAIKTGRYEPRILRGDWMAIEEFYGREIRLAVTAYAATVSA